MSEGITVALVDDHEIVRQGVRALLETQPDITIVGEASSGEEGVRLSAEHAPDVVLMDLVMPGMNGVEATRQIKQQSPRTQVIVLTSYHEDEHILPAIRAGALSYLLKDVSPAELLAPMPGAVVRVHAAVESAVSAGDPIVTLEAMKMEHVVVAPIDGRLAEVMVRPTDQVRRGQLLAVVAP